MPAWPEPSGTTCKASARCASSSRKLDGVAPCAARTLTAAGATLDDVALINSFHVWEGPDFTGTRDQQIEIIAKVWREFATGPRPAWTAVGTTGLLGEHGIVEIQLTVHAPQDD